jgi:peptidyl-prolyl cis-trans isomerase C
MIRPADFFLLVLSISAFAGAAAAQPAGAQANSPTPSSAPPNAAQPSAATAKSAQPGTAKATAAQPNIVLAQNALATLTRADYDKELQRLPADMRGAFATDRRRITALLNNLLMVKTLAAEARQAGISADGADPSLDVERWLAQQQTKRMNDAAAAEFDARLKEYEPRVRELYLVGKSKYRSPEQISVSQILIATSTRSDEAALALAKQARDRVLAGADFAQVAREVSDDSTAKSDGGKIDWFTLAQKDPAFGRPAFELKNLGDVSEPVRTSAGYHLIRLDGRRPAAQLTFEEAKPQIIADLRNEYVETKRENHLNAIRNDPQLKVNQRAVDSLLVRVDPRLMKPRPSPPTSSSESAKATPKLIPAPQTQAR